jgi:prepilin-type N-terminal cleavage/methylation domain-containing protein
MRSSCRNRKGFSLAEAVIATVVLGIAAAGVLLPFTSGVSVRAEGERRTLAAKLASDLMEKIISDHFNGSDIVNNNYSELQGQIRDAAGNLLKDTDPSYTNFSRGASCEYDASQPFFIIVTVWVKYNGNEIVSLKRLISK